MSRRGDVATRFGSFASRVVVGISVAALVAAIGVSQLGVLAGARAVLADRAVLSWAGLFAALAIAQALVYGMIVIASVTPAVRRLAEARHGAPRGSGELVADDVRLSLWLIAWAVVAMAIRAALAQGLGVAALLPSP